MERRHGNDRKSGPAKVCCPHTNNIYVVHCANLASACTTLLGISMSATFVNFPECAKFACCHAHDRIMEKIQILYMYIYFDVHAREHNKPWKSSLACPQRSSNIENRESQSGIWFERAYTALSRRAIFYTHTHDPVYIDFRVNNGEKNDANLARLSLDVLKRA